LLSEIELPVQMRGCLMGDGKTLATSTVVSYYVDLEQP